jgi:hypothetical protein
MVDVNPVQRPAQGYSAATRPSPLSNLDETMLLPDVQVLPRADVLILGGDLAYPNPSNETYEKRLFRCILVTLVSASASMHDLLQMHPALHRTKAAIAAAQAI